MTLAGIENMDLLGSPGYASPSEDVAALHSGDRATLVVTGLCGALALLCYLAFVLAVWALPRAQDPVAGRWPAVGLALWVDPTGAGSYLPFTPPSLSGRVLGGWAFLLAALAAWSGARARVGEAARAVLALVAFPVGALVAAARSFGDLDPDRRGAYVAALAAWPAIALVVALRAGSRS